jgi:hypothetical protein
MDNEKWIIGSTRIGAQILLAIGLVLYPIFPNLTTMKLIELIFLAYFPYKWIKEVISKAFSGLQNTLNPPNLTIF